MSGIYDEELCPEVSANQSCSMNTIGDDDDDDWVIVKKQRITILIPPLSPDATSPQADTLIISSKHSSLTSSKRNWDAARKKHPKQMTSKKSQDSSPEDGSSEKAQVNHSETIVHKGVPRMSGEISPQSLAAPVGKSESIKGAGPQRLFHQDTAKLTSSFGSMGKPMMPAVSSAVTNKIMRARLLEKRVAGFGGLRNWLFTCGLGWFVDILDRKKLGMYQLVSLTMDQLKEMGLAAVGPRRKLIHAIDSLCRPHQFGIVS